MINIYENINYIILPKNDYIIRIKYIIHVYCIVNGIKSKLNKTIGMWQYFQTVF